MNKVHRKVEYSLMALKHMSLKRQGELTTAKEVSERYDAPFETIARALQLMAQRGLLRSEQGAQGGYFISKDLEQVSLLDLVETMEGPTRIAKCLGPDDACDIRGKCNIQSPIQNLNLRLKDFYQSVSLRELLRTGGTK